MAAPWGREEPLTPRRRDARLWRAGARARARPPGPDAVRAGTSAPRSLRPCGAASPPGARRP